MSGRRLAFLFPGQGSQRPGMGRELVEAFPEAGEVFDEADQALERSMSELCFDGSAEDLALTENTQPAILTVSVATLRVLEARGIRAEVAAGHSLGEYSAHVAAGTFAFGDAVGVVRARGRFMQQAVPVGVGAMAAILGLDTDSVTELCRRAADGEIVNPANLNSPSQVVVAGHAAAVDRVMHSAREAGARRVVKLPVSAPFHCALMEPAADRLRPLLDSVDLAEAAFPVVTNVDARAVRSADEARDALQRQVVAPVRWQECVQEMIDRGIDTFVEIGPGRVLCGLVRALRRDVATYHSSDRAALESLLEALA